VAERQFVFFGGIIVPDKLAEVVYSICFPWVGQDFQIAAYQYNPDVKFPVGVVGKNIINCLRVDIGDCAKPVPNYDYELEKHSGQTAYWQD